MVCKQTYSWGPVHFCHIPLSYSKYAQMDSINNKQLCRFMVWDTEETRNEKQEQRNKKINSLKIKRPCFALA